MSISEFYLLKNEDLISLSYVEAIYGQCVEPTGINNAWSGLLNDFIKM